MLRLLARTILVTVFVFFVESTSYSMTGTYCPDCAFMQSQQGMMPLNMQNLQSMIQPTVNSFVAPISLQPNPVPVALGAGTMNFQFNSPGQFPGGFGSGNYGFPMLGMQDPSFQVGFAYALTGSQSIAPWDYDWRVPMPGPMGMEVFNLGWGNPNLFY